MSAYGSAHYSASAARGDTYNAAPKPQPATLQLPIATAMTHPAGATAAQKAWADAQHAATKLDEYVNGLRAAAADPKYTSDNVREHIAAFADTEAGRAVTRSVETVRATAEAAQLAAQRALGRIVGQEGDTAAELRNSRFWARTERLLDAIDNGAYLGKVSDLVRNANPNELGVLAQELPAYLESKGADAGFVDTLLAEAAPEYGAAKRRVTAANQALLIAEANQRHLQRRYAQAYPTPAGHQPLPTTPLAGWDAKFDPELI
ncbi:hypothetical protein ACAG26_06890 [Mycobacterium sp. pUA109]|uniref:hypothetical protein n=1 Tax=Mycobacterium sp. pUA109 TaxID=3238982 RepID=UPI00351AD489